MSYGQSTGLTPPVVGTTVGPDYATDINEIILAILACIEAKVTPGGMTMSSDLDFKPVSTYSGITNLSHVKFENKSSAMSAVTYPGTAYEVSGELYWNDGSGRQVQITNAGVVGTSNGAVTGTGYGSSGVEVNWSSGDSAYLLKSGSSANSYAHLWCNNVRLSDLSDHYVGLDAQSMSASYTLTFPASLPTLTTASNTPLFSTDASGNMSYTQTPQLQTLTLKGAAVFESTVNVVGALSLSGAVSSPTSLTLAAGGDVTVSTTGRYNHGSMYQWINANKFQINENTSGITRNSGYIALNDNTANSLYCPIELPGGARITAATIYFDRTGTSGSNFIASIYRTTAGSSTPTQLATASSSATAFTALSITSVALPYTIPDSNTLSAGGSVYAVISGSDNLADTVRVYTLVITYDYP